MQRLFTTFAGGWPGFGLLVQRAATGVALLHNGFATLEKLPAGGPIVPEMAGAVLGMLILAGLWTPVAGGLIAAVEFWIALDGRSDIGVSLLLAVLGATLAMIGPGAWSIDAQFFGRKHLGS